MGSIGMDRGFLVSRDGIFKILQFIFSLLMLIMISATGYTYLKELGTFVYITFAGSFYCITLFMSFLIYFFKLYNLGLCGRIPWKILEIGYSALCALLAVIAIGVAAQKANDLKLANDPLVADIYRLSAAASVSFIKLCLNLNCIHIKHILKKNPVVPQKQNGLVLQLPYYLYI
ncbi:unnamed protein product [Clavelina lepadiformis]|uniref:MARVEL domain-containing protein n=1 Tax=Clavelina lepadiformis TaxID=159417 RepID=A0ABP0F242_CLALP